MAERARTHDTLDPDFLDDLAARIAAVVKEETGLSVSKVSIEQPFVGPDEDEGITVYVNIKKQNRSIGGAQTIAVIRSVTDAIHRVREDMYPVVIPRFAEGQQVA